MGSLAFSEYQPCRTPYRKSGFWYASGGRGALVDRGSNPGRVSRR